MDMSAAALPPRQPPISEADRKHEWFPIYQAYRASMSALLVEADSFQDWKRHREWELGDRALGLHPQYREFRDWMNANQGGARRCPAGDFPLNFLFWLEGGRW